MHKIAENCRQCKDFPFVFLVVSSLSQIKPASNQPQEKRKDQTRAGWIVEFSRLLVISWDKLFPTTFGLIAGRCRSSFVTVLILIEETARVRYYFWIVICIQWILHLFRALFCPQSAFRKTQCDSWKFMIPTIGRSCAGVIYVSISQKERKISTTAVSRWHELPQIFVTSFQWQFVQWSID